LTAQTSLDATRVGVIGGFGFGDTGNKCVDTERSSRNRIFGVLRLAEKWLELLQDL